MEYFFYCRDKPNSGPLRKQIVETHWSFMDAYARAFVARGPTLTEGGAQTGSMHIVDLPDAEAVRVFAYEEPNYKAGVYGDVFVSRWRNELGRTMWEFKGDPEHNKRFLIIGRGKPGMSEARNRLQEARRRYFIDNGYEKCFIAHGPLFSDDGTQWAGSAMMVELPDRAAAEAMMADDPYVRAGLYDSIEIHNWRFGGRH
jgi:uncharacterized protein YciI